MNTNFSDQRTNDIHATDAANQDSAAVDLFAEELPEQHDHAIPGMCCIFTASSVGGCLGCLGSLSTSC